MKNYDHIKIEKKWQKEWDKKKIYQAKNNKGKKFYSLIEFPYPSGAGLHVGHVRSNTAMDIISRKKRMEGYNILYPIGWDAFGLPTENYAIKTGIAPEKVTKQNTDIFRKQLKSIGFSFDWDREVNTTDPNYYKWTQWIFLQMFKKGLAYKQKTMINWCPSCKIGLANEEVVDGKCERCGTETTKKEKEQWMLAITRYADRLDKDLDDVDYLEKIKIQQRNWIGKSDGSEISFQIISDKIFNNFIKVFTTRADTLFGATYVVLAPEHNLIQELRTQISNWKEVEKYIKEIKNKADIERTALGKEKTGVELKGLKAINPANNEEIPIWIADYVLASYGTGAVMAVPAHDERDWEFAKKYNLPIKEVVIPREGEIHIGAEYRRTISAVIHRKRDDKYLVLKWNDNFDWISPSIGGIENNESVEDAAIREVFEETGYKVRFVDRLGGMVESHFFAKNKNVWRFRHDFPVLCELIDENLEPSIVLKNEKELHSVLWISAKEALEKISHEYNKIGLKRYLSKNYSFIDYGYLINSKQFDGLSSLEARKEITKFVGGKIVTKYKLRDWVFSRQRYWGEPIPLIHCDKCGYVPVSDKDLPVVLPKVKSYEPTDNGESPLATIKSWVDTKCPKCKGKAKRETDTMPNWAGSSWYYLRYTDTKNKKEFANKKLLKYWTPVDWYNGGMEHVTLHLLYSRFWHKFLYDLKLVPTKEPYKKRTAHGMILAEDGEKMSKSRGNVINPDEIIKLYGADTLRIYEMFIGPFDQTVVWSTKSIIGSRRFLEKVWRIGQKVASPDAFPKVQGPGGREPTPDHSEKHTGSANIENILHKTIKKMGEDIEKMNFNTAISSMMILVNEMENEKVSKKDFKTLLQLLAPFAPHISDELWFILGEKKSIHFSPWPKWDDKKIVDEMIKIAVQVNGKFRTEIVVLKDLTEENIKMIALANQNILSWVKEKEIKRIIYVPGRVINIVV